MDAMCAYSEIYREYSNHPNIEPHCICTGEYSYWGNNMLVLTDFHREHAMTLQSIHTYMYPRVMVVQGICGYVNV